MLPNSRLKLALAEDHTLVAQALARVLEDHFELTDVVQDGGALVAAVRESRPDLVVTDLRMPKVDGMEAIHAIRQMPDPPPIVVLSTYGNAALARQALDAGAAGYVLKQSATSELVDALMTVHAGRRFVSPLLDVRPATAQSRGPHNGPRRLPTPRQCQVLELIARGYRMKDIASRLQISRRTVESHKYHLMESLGAESTADLVQHALRLSLIGLGDSEPSKHAESMA